MLAVLLVVIGSLAVVAGVAVLCWPVALIVVGLAAAGIGLFVDLEKPEPDL